MCPLESVIKYIVLDIEDKKETRERISIRAKRHVKGQC